MAIVTTITRKGQVTIPITYRKKMGLKTGRKVQFKQKSDGELIIKPVLDFLSMRGFFKTKRKYSKSKARRAYEKELLKGNL